MPIINPNSISREEYLKRKRKKKIIRWSIFFSFFFLLFFVLCFVSWRNSLRINNFTLNGGVLVTEKEVFEKSKEFLSGRKFLFFPKNNSFIYPKDDLKKYLMDSFKRIETIQIKQEKLTELKITITERKPVAIWCQSLEENQRCYFMDINSTIFAEAPEFSGDAYFKYYGVFSSENPIGKEFIASTTLFHSINNFIEGVKKLNIKPQYLTAKEEGEFSLTIFGGGQIYFDTRKSLENTLDNLYTLLSSSELSIKNGLLPVEYVDLRYGNKLYYKLKTQ